MLLVALCDWMLHPPTIAQLYKSWLKMRLRVKRLRDCRSLRRLVVPSGVPPAPTTEMRDVPGPAFVPLSSLLKYSVNTTGRPLVCGKQSALHRLSLGATRARLQPGSAQAAAQRSRAQGGVRASVIVLARAPGPNRSTALTTRARRSIARLAPAALACVQRCMPFTRIRHCVRRSASLVCRLRSVRTGASSAMKLSEAQRSVCAQVAAGALNALKISAHSAPTLVLACVRALLLLGRSPGVLPLCFSRPQALCQFEFAS